MNDKDFIKHTQEKIQFHKNSIERLTIALEEYTRYSSESDSDIEVSLTTTGNNPKFVTTNRAKISVSVLRDWILGVLSDGIPRTTSMLYDMYAKNEHDKDEFERFRFLVTQKLFKSKIVERHTEKDRPNQEKYWYSLPKFFDGDGNLHEQGKTEIKKALKEVPS